MKRYLTILMILIACVVYSQTTTNDTICITANQAKKAIRNAQLVSVLQSQIAIQELLIATKDTLVAKKDEKLQLELSKYSLLQDNYEILNTQYTSLKATKKKKTWFRDALVVLGAIGTGYLIGSQ